MPVGPALKKLEYVDELMSELAGVRPPTAIRDRVDPLSRLSETLGEHYQKKQAFYTFEPPKTYDRDLSRLFSADQRHRRAQPAASFIRRHRAQVMGAWSRDGRSRTSLRSMPFLTT